MGWMFVAPYENALVFYANTAPGKFQWNLATLSSCPYFQARETNDWIYMVPNPFGWFCRPADGEWFSGR